MENKQTGKVEDIFKPLASQRASGAPAGQGSPGLGLDCVDDLTPPAVRSQTDSGLVFTQLPRTASSIREAFALICAQVSSDLHAAPAAGLPPQGGVHAGSGPVALVADSCCKPSLSSRHPAGQREDRGAVGGVLRENASSQLAEM